MSETVHESKPIRRQLAPNCYMILSSLAQIANDTEMRFQADRGAIDQTALYIDPSSAYRWYAVANQPDYLEAHSGRETGDIAKQIRSFHGKDIEHIDVFALGSGDGKNETRLTQHVIEQFPSVELLLWDISHPLLGIAYTHATSVLGSSLKGRVSAVFGNMHDIAQSPYIDLYNHQPPESKRLITMLGCTFGNLESEIVFVRNNFSGFAKGDLLLLDVVKTFAPADQPDAVKQKDPRLSHQHTRAWDTAYEEFLSNVVYRNCRAVKSVEFFQELDSSACVVKGSYAISMQARIQLMDGREKVFSMMQYKRYDINELVRAMEERGWKGSTGWPYGQNRMLYLFEKAF